MSMDAVLSAYSPDLARRVWMSVGGGFSGATVWKGMAPDGSAVALKKWPAGFPADRLCVIHHWMRAVADLPFVPRIVPNRSGETVVQSAGRLWDLSTWLPGIPDSHPTDERLAAACRALAEFHRRTAVIPADAGQPRFTEIPAVRRRLALFGSYRSWQAENARPPVTAHTGLNAACAEAFSLLPQVLPELGRVLQLWRGQMLPAFPCLCDVHTGHVLFTGDSVAGVIDYGAMKIDHPAVDLARYLGAATTGDAGRLNVGLDAYRRSGPPVEVPAQLVELLDRSGTAGGLANWLLRISAGHPIEDPKTVARRMARMLSRLADSPGGTPALM